LIEGVSVLFSLLENDVRRLVARTTSEGLVCEDTLALDVDDRLESHREIERECEPVSACLAGLLVAAQTISLADKLHPSRRSSFFPS
jgi:hypothetical protein